MRVVVNRLAALGVKTGIGHYTTQLLGCLAEQARPGEVEAFPHPCVRHVRQAAARRRQRLEGVGPEPGGGSPRLAAVQLAALGLLRGSVRAALTGYLRALCWRRRYDLYHEPNFIPLRADVPTVATIHDLSVVVHPEWHPRDRVAHFERHFARGLRQCVHFLAISEAGRQEVIRHLGIPPERVTRTYMGIRPGLGPLPGAEVERVRRQLGLPPRYLLCLGTVEPRKNVLTLLRAYCGLPAPVRARCPLLLVGSWGWNTADVAEYFHREARHRGVLQLGYVAEEHVAALYNGACALAYPTRYEGFGLPPVEMMACGGAVLASTADAVVETVGGRAHLTPADDVDGWRAALSRAATDDDWLRDLRRGVQEVARPFTWEACAAETLRVYRMLTGEAMPATPPMRRAG